MSIIFELLQEQKLKEYEEEFMTLLQKTKDTLNEVVGNPAVRQVSGDLDVQLQELGKRLEAARRGLTLSNKLKGPEKAQNASRVMSNMNMIRATFARVYKQLAQTVDNANQQVKQFNGQNRMQSTGVAASPQVNEPTTQASNY